MAVVKWFSNKAVSRGVLSLICCAGSITAETRAAFCLLMPFQGSSHVKGLSHSASQHTLMHRRNPRECLTHFTGYFRAVNSFSHRSMRSNWATFQISASARDSCTRKRFGVVGGGPAGFMAAIQAARTAAEAGTSLDVIILEATSKVLSKVKISGGGRCNVLHDETKGIKTIADGYPRGKKQLLGALSRFGPVETASWFRSEGVELKTEADGRMFPVTDDSQTIVDALCRAADDAGVTVRTRMRVDGVERGGENGVFQVRCSKRGEGEEHLTFDYLLLSPGSSRLAYEWASGLGHVIESPVPSLFTFNSDDTLLDGLAGVSVQDVVLSLPLPDSSRNKKQISERGPVLVTHFGLSGPALLRLSAFGARALFDVRYKTTLTLNWLPDLPRGAEGAMAELNSIKKVSANKAAGGSSTPTLTLPRRLWKSLVVCSGIDPDTRWSEVKTTDLRKLAKNLVAYRLDVKGKGVFKEEFVTAGGVGLKGVDMKRMESKAVPGLFFAGELLDVDGITGGYNLQSAWSTGTAAGRAVADLAASEVLQVDPASAEAGSQPASHEQPGQ